MARVTLSKNKKRYFDFPNLSMQDEFIPVVQLDTSSINKYSIAAMVEGKNKTTLSDTIESEKREIVDTTLIVGPGDTKIPFKVEKGLPTMDNDGFILPKIDKKVDGITVKPDKPTKVNIGDNFDITISVLKNKEFKSVIDYYASDDEDDLNKGEIKDIFCGRINIAFYPDVFTKREAESLVTEINYLKSFVENESPSEYAGNYCMAAAERGLSKLLKNDTDFYSVDISHTRLNAITFGGKRAMDRGSVFDSAGYVINKFIFKDFNINHNLRVKTKNNSDLSNNMYDVVTITKGSALLSYIQNGTQDKPGYHVYYMSVSEDFHTLLLVVDNSDCLNETYTVYDQHGRTSSYGKLEDVEIGIARQTSWTFLYFYAEKGYDPDTFGGVTTKLWKIQRK